MGSVFDGREHNIQCRSGRKDMIISLVHYRHGVDISGRNDFGLDVIYEVLMLKMQSPFKPPVDLYNNSARTEKAS